MQSSNPAIAVLNRQAGAFNFGGTDLAATISGTTTKALILVALTLICGFFSMNYSIYAVYTTGQVPSLLVYGSLIAALVVAMITIFKPQSSPITAPIYAVLEGVALGALSGIFEIKYPGIASTAVLSTFVVVISMLALWKFKIIVPTARFRAIITGAVAGVAVLYIICLLYTSPSPRDA